MTPLPNVCLNDLLDQVLSIFVTKRRLDNDISPPGDEYYCHKFHGEGAQMSCL